MTKTTLVSWFLSGLFVSFAVLPLRAWDINGPGVRTTETEWQDQSANKFLREATEEVSISSAGVIPLGGAGISFGGGGGGSKRISGAVAGHGSSRSSPVSPVSSMIQDIEGGFSFSKVIQWSGGNREYPVGPFVANYKVTNQLTVPRCGRFEFEHPLTWNPPKIAEGNPVNCMVVACWGKGRYVCMGWDWCGIKGRSAFNKSESCAQGPEYYVFVISVPGGERTNVVRLK